MRLFVFEYITGGSLAGEELPQGMLQEGDLMLRSLLIDLLERDDLELIVMRDSRAEELQLPVTSFSVASQFEFGELWSRCMDVSDAIWPIAPENDHILTQISETVVKQGKRLLNSAPEAVSLASSKIATLAALREKGMKVVPTCRPYQKLPVHGGSWVIKPDDGAGCDGIRLCRNTVELRAYLERKEPDANLVIQPFLSGDALSIGFITDGREVRLLSVNRQRIAVSDGRFVLLGCEVNGIKRESRSYELLAAEVVSAISGLWGYVGVDFIENDDGIHVLEVNPRLTTSYAGLRESTGINAAELILELAAEACLPSFYLRETKPVDINLEHAGGI